MRGFLYFSFMKYFLSLITLSIIIACSSNRPPGKYRLTDTLSVSGDFDGDGKSEVITSYLTDSTDTRLYKAYDPYDWDNTVIYYSKMVYSTVVRLENGKGNILNYYANGLFCLINLGDINKDNKDEIALVPALLDWSNINTCRIYSLCNGKWTELEAFNINESAFYYASSTEPVFDNIPGYLEKRNGVWMFRTNTEIMEAEIENVPFKILQLKTCE